MRDPAPVETFEHPENPHELSDSPQTRTDHERDDCGNAGRAETPPATHPTPPHPTMGGAASASSEDPDLPKPQYAEGEDGQVTPDRSVEKMEMALQMAGVGDAKACASIMVDAGATIDDVAALRASVSRADDPGGVMVKAIREGTWRDRLAAQQARRDEPNADSRIQTDPHAIERMQVDLERRGIERLDLRLHERAAITEIASAPTLTLDRLSGWIDHIQAAHGVENVPDYLQRFLSATPDVWRASFEHVESGASAAVSATSAASPPPSSNGDADAMYGEPVASDGKSEGP